MMNEKKLITPPGMKRFYFTYGTDARFPFFRGWTEVVAPDKEAACAVFQCYHPNRPDSAALNCAWIYTEEEFRKTCMYRGDYPGEFCHEVIGPQYSNHATNEE